MAQIRVIQGDVTKPVIKDNWVIAHVCNNAGYWGRGVSGTIGRAYPKAEQRYREAYARLGGGKRSYTYGDQIRLDTWLGHTVYAQVDLHGRQYVANMIAQDGIKTQYGCNVPTRLIAPQYGYPYLKSCLIMGLGPTCQKQRFSVHIPLGMGAGNAGGDWLSIYSMVEEILVHRFEVDVFVYRLEQQPCVQFHTAESEALAYA